MNQFLDKTKAQVLLYKIAIIFVILYSLDSIATAFVSVMIDTQWSELDGTQKWIRVALIAKAWASSMLAFFTNVGKKIQSDQPFFNGDTQTFRKTDTQQQTTEITNK